MKYSPELVARLTEAMRARFPDPETVLGSYLGSVIRRELIEGLDLKAEFGSLKSLIDTHLFQYIREVGRSGADLEFFIDFANPAPLASVEARHTTQARPAAEVAPTPSGQARPSHRGIAINAWRALANPSSIIRAVWSPSEQKLELVWPDGVPSELPQLKPITYDDLNEITRTFLAHKNVQVPLERADPSKPRRYGPQIMGVLRESGLYGEWDAYRTEKILELLRARLLSLGANEPTAQTILSEIVASKPQQNATSLPVNPTPPLSTPDRVASLTVEEKLRSFFVRAIQTMSVEELRELKISGTAIEKALRSLS